MDSLLANYASSDEEEEQVSANPKPKFNSLPPPHTTSLFSSLPKPSLDSQHIIKPSSSSSSQTPKRVVQFIPPPVFANPTTTHLDDDDDDDEDQQRRRRKASSAAQPQSVTSFLSAIPAPRNSGASSGLGSGVGSGRRAIVDTKVPESDPVLLDRNENVVSSYDDSVSNNAASYDDSVSNNVPSYKGYGGYESYQQYGVESGYQLQAGVSGVDASGYGGYSGSGEGHGNGWADGPQAAAMMSVSSDSGVRASGKRRRNDVPTEIVEVKQDELMKNRPREDQAKVTGIAFGPSYQPVSAKGKPTKLHKRKHQIGSLYFDMKQKEMELQERRSKGFLTKAETQAKYGW